MKSKAFIYISLAVDLIIAASKFTAAAFTGSSSMVSEGIHSIIDAISQLLLIWGIKTSARKPDLTRPFGYGKELYFWSFIVSLLIFVMGGCVSVYQGIIHINSPNPDSNQGWDYAVLGIAFIFTAISLNAAKKEFNRERGKIYFWKAIIQTKNPSTIIVLLGDVGDMLGLIIAFAGVFLGHLYRNPYYDVAASIVIGVIMIAISALLVRESKSLLLGESTSRTTLKKIILLAQADDAVIKVKKHFSTYMSPEEVLLQLNTVFKDNLTTRQITDAIERITKAIQTDFPRIKQIFIEPVK
ncbi:cation diffusion facilitator family transporter [Mucilaginibacter sp. L3T2-6]|uniref:cation diffusion facilitator family transporter n=1 Tax=Mucilaginibacter sp. L3T2-6 TaxID=3062491 RepID=UPI002676B431|nr:cation diffusion facilitator family transporter [Mucilaginibacter sp. L3T2-6]MDO3642854.1 cation diffusion facilitator family transporter [Mucilaginibacter sp. L3T2-6]MDV6215179.1 cation diffusion facilitator family transporter [Mucilaginibacter sp. L3T2-6]